MATPAKAGWTLTQGVVAIALVSWLVGMLVGVGNGLLRLQSLRAQAHAELVAEAKAATASIHGQLSLAEHILKVVALAPLVRSFSPICNDLIEAWRSTLGTMTTRVVLTDSTGLVRCGSPAEALDRRIDDSFRLEDVVETSDTLFSTIVRGLVSGEEVIAVSRRWYPLEAGTGMATAAVRVAHLVQPDPPAMRATGLWLADIAGHVRPLLATAPLPPPDDVLADIPRGVHLRTASVDGERLLLAVDKFSDTLGVVATRRLREIEREAVKESLISTIPKMIALAFAAIAVVVMVRWALVNPLAELANTLNAPRGSAAAAPPPRMPRELTMIWQKVLDYRDAVADRESQLEQELALRQELMREVHHRTKNNLQIVSSLLALQEHEAKDGEAAAQLRAARDRVATLATIHEKLFGGGAVDRVELKEFLSDLAKRIAYAADADARGIAVSVEAEPLALHMDLAGPVGLIVNELMTNSLKYAFPGDARGRIRITARRVGQDIEVVVADDGIGAPGTGVPEGGLGSTLVAAFARKLDGTVERREGPGTIIALRFPAAAEA
ncbi:sensor histidine kinase [Elioraea rosea]|uniref:sensor histidine kinase n=1 Tax=Elioraea rosea TaxID=2492390 RepID=UPI00131505C9|nr:sensor histidine kinase [Elioraea rosea]